MYWFKGLVVHQANSLIWKVQSSQIRSVCAISRLFFLLAVTTLYVTAQGVEVVSSGKRRWVDPHWFRGNSYFPIGWIWVKSAARRGWQLIEKVLLASHIDLQPAPVSYRQYQQLSFGFSLWWGRDLARSRRFN